MAINKVEANGETLIDLTSDNVTADTLVSGRTAHLASGAQVTGTFEPVTGVKGNAESTYRKGNVNLTPANIGAATSEQGTKADTAVQTIQIGGTAQIKTNGTVNLPAYPTKSSLGLGNVDNTSDANKPISTAAQAAFDNQQAQLDKTIKRDNNNDVIEEIRTGNITTTRTLILTSNTRAILQGLNEAKISAGTAENPGIIEISATNNLISSAIKIVEDTSGNGIEIGKNDITLLVGNNALVLNRDGLKYNGITLPIANNAGFHNSIFRGKYLGSSFTSVQKAAIANSTFDDLFVGDYWHINNIHWRIAHCNYYLNTGDTATTVPHLAIVPDESLTTSYMNATNVTTGAYAGSYMNTTTLLQDGTEASDSVFGKIKAAFGEENLLSIRQLFTSAVDGNGNVSGWAWYNTRCFLMNQCMVYGNKAWANGNNDGFNVGIDKSQLALFAHDTSAINRRYTYWLRDVRSSADFVRVDINGPAAIYVASGVIGVRPVFLLKGA